MRSILATAALAIVAVEAVHLTPDALGQVYNNAVRLNKLSWENGSLGETLLEWKYPELSVFAATAPLPLPDLTADKVPDIVSMARDTLNNRPRVFNNPAIPSSSSAAPSSTAQEGDMGIQRRQGTPTSVPAASGTAAPSASSTAQALNVPIVANTALPRGQPLLEDGAAGDPPSLGVTVLVADKASPNTAVNGVTFMQAAQSQVDYLLYGVPRTKEGAISHRAASVQLWADNVYMVPPFLAYFAAVTNNATLMQIAFDQVRLYRAGLQDEQTKLWRHMTEGPEAGDPNLWATGNAWAAAGILRVLATIKRSQFAGAMGDQQTQLQTWAAEILTACKSFVTHDGLLRNYIDNSTTFVDAAATALMASAGFRMSTLNLTNDHVDLASDMLAGASRNVNSTGYVTNVTDPYKFSEPGTYSPEGNSFVLLAYAAYNEWDKMGKPGSTRGKDPLSDGAGRMGVGIGGVLVAVGVSVFCAL